MKQGLGKKKFKLRGQVIIEYFLLMTVILAAILSTSFITQVRLSFEGYFKQAVERIK